MTTRGIAGNEREPWDIATELVHLEERTSDPTKDGPMLWFRSDLDDTTLDPSKYGELRLYDGSTTTSIPIFPIGESQDGVDEAIEFETKHGTGFVPIAELGDVPELEIQHSGSVWEFHDGQGPVAASGDTVTVGSTNTIRANGVNVQGTIDVNGTMEVHAR